MFLAFYFQGSSNVKKEGKNRNAFQTKKSSNNVIGKKIRIV